MHKYITLMLSVAVAIGLTACSTMTSTQDVSVGSQQSWALLPFNNLSTTPRAGEKTSTIVETHLRARGVDSLNKYREADGMSLVSLLDAERQLVDAIAWAKASGHRYGVSGTVHEWHYKSGPDKEPAVGLSIKLIDLSNEKVIWQGTNAKTGWGYSNLSGVADDTVSKLLKQIRISGSN